MAWSKREFVVQAFEEIGIANYNYDLSPEMFMTALRRMDAMLASWNVKGIRIGYPLPSTPNSSDLNQSTNVPDSANEAIYLNLGIRLAGGFGKAVSMELKQNAKAALDGLYLIAAQPIEMQFPNTMPAGAGNKPWRYSENPFLNTPTDPITTGPDGVLSI
jgi:hypothetical protein